MKILFVTYDFPFPITSGGKNRAYNLLKNTAQKADIFLYSFVREDFHPDFIPEIKSIGVKQAFVHKRKKLGNIANIPQTIFKNCSIFKTLYYDKKVALELKKIIQDNDIDVIHFESSYTGFYINSLLSRMKVRMVLGTENIEFKLYQDYAKSQKPYLKPFISYQANRLKKEELEMVKNADSVITVTKEESDMLFNLTGKESNIVANGIDPKMFSYQFNKKIQNNILFVGNFSYFPNIDAVNFFYENIFDKLDKSITLTIVGKKVKEKFKFNNNRIIMKEFVEDIVSEYRSADMLIFSVRIGGGTNFKVLEAMSLGIPIVAYPNRMEGLRAVNEEHFLEARTGDEYIEQIKKLYGDAKLRETLSYNARLLIEKYYAWNNIGKDLLDVWKNVID
jgi:glycosyltransferase involved in cell wall biosynthesis